MTNLSNQFYSKLRNKQKKEAILLQTKYVTKTIEFSDDVIDYYYDVASKEFKKFEESGRAVLVTSEFEVARLKKYCRDNRIAI